MAQAGEARLAEILRDALPNANPLWGVNRLRKELGERGYVFKEQTSSPGALYENPSTREQVRLMQRPAGSTGRADPTQKFLNEYYYRYRANENAPWGRHVTVPDK